MQSINVVLADMVAEAISSLELPRRVCSVRRMYVPRFDLATDLEQMQVIVTPRAYATSAMTRGSHNESVVSVAVGVYRKLRETDSATVHQQEVDDLMGGFQQIIDKLFGMRVIEGTTAEGLSVRAQLSTMEQGELYDRDRLESEGTFFTAVTFTYNVVEVKRA